MKCSIWQALLGSALIAGCARANIDGRTHIRLSIFNSPSEVRLAKQWVTAFERSNLDVAVDVEPVDAGNYAAKLGLQSAAGTLPDVIFLPDSLVPTLCHYRILRDLRPLIGSDKGFDVGEFYSEMLQNGLSEDGSLVMLPRELSTVVMFYNRTLLKNAHLEDPPRNWNWDTLRAYLRRLTVTAGDGSISQSGLTASYSWAGIYGPCILSNGGSLLSADGAHSQLASPLALRALQDLTDLVVKERTAMPPGSESGAGGLDPFTRGLAAMRPGVFASVPAYRKLMSGYDWDVQIMPAGRRGRVTMAGAAGYGISSATNNVGASWRFVKFMLGRLGQTMMANSGSGIPVLRSLAWDPSWRSANLPPKNVSAFIESARFGATWKNQLLFARPEVEDVVRSAFERVFTGKQSAQAAFSQADVEVDGLIARDRDEQ